MQTISTKFLGATTFLGERIVATATETKNRMIFSYDYELTSTDNHCAAACDLRDNIGWEGEMIGGHTKEGMVFVFNSTISPRI